MILLEQSGYRLDRRTGVWARPGYEGLSYNDGDESEARIARILREASDLSVLSPELTQHCTDWVSLYHLGRARGNILRPFTHCLSGDVLEIGAGCGAISRCLGEAGARVISLEGSVRRARIAASRTRDLDNVTVIAERFEQFQSPQRFDVITLIGVLEYAGLFNEGDDPALNMLTRVRELLNPEGVLLLAIENQLGLKYFAGAPEDHLGTPMSGIEDRYLINGPQTFGRQRLNRLLEQAGFSRSEFLCPAPDYKLANAIVTQRGFEHPDFDAAALLWQNVRRDPQLPIDTLFNLERAWPVVLENGLGMELANSFLVAASCSLTPLSMPNLLASHYNVSRNPGYCKQTLFLETPDGIEVINQPLSSEASQHPDFRHVLSPVDPYRHGRVLSQAFLEIANTPEWTLVQFGVFVRRHLAALRTLLAEHGQPMVLERLDEQLPGLFADAVPHNILLDGEGRPALIDSEWVFPKGIELGHLLVRSLLLLIATATPFCPGVTPFSRRRFITQTLLHAGLEMAADELDRFIEKEAQFQSVVTGVEAAHFLQWEPDQIINPRDLPVSTGVKAKLYCSDEAGHFDEQEALSHEVLPGHQQLRFPLDALESPTRLLRLDPVDQRKTFSLDNVRIVNGDELIWAWDGRIDALFALSGLQEVERIGTCVLFISLDDDPCLQLPVDLSQRDDVQDLAVMLDLTLYTDEVMARKISQSLESGRQYETVLHSVVGPMTEQLQTLTQQVSGLDHTAQLIEQRVASSEAGLLDAIKHLLQESGDDRNEHEALVAHLQTALLDMRIEKDTHIHQLNLQIQALEGSCSRRLAAPVRYSILKTRRLVHASRRLPALIRRGGGLKATTRRAAMVLREQGFRGLMDRVLWFNAGQAPTSVQAAAATDVQPFDRHDYSAWIARYDTLDDGQRMAMLEDVGTWEKTPLISVIMPVFDPPLELLREAIDSVVRQVYPHWELCIADDASRNPAVRELLNRAQRQHAQIKIVLRDDNGHISVASNSALDLATGSYVALMDHDDLLPEHALYWMAQAIVRHPHAGLIYSDEDKVDEQGRRSAPYFKPDWNAFLFRSQNMVSHFGVYQRDLVERVGRFRKGYEGSQDYDLALRCIEQLSPSHIIHVPRVLYHWRIHAGSTAVAPQEKPYAVNAAVRALDDHLQRTGCQASTELLPFGMYRVHYALPKEKPLVSLIIPTRNAGSLLKQCIDSIRRLTTYPNYEIIVIDNGSDEAESLGYFAQIGQQPDITVLRDDGPFNYSALNNRAVSRARGQLVGLINNDIEVISPDWLEEMVALALQPGVGAVGARLWFADDRLQHGGVILGVGGIANHAHKFLPRGEYGYFGRAVLTQEFSAVTAACLVIRRSVFEQVGGLDEMHLKVAFNDVDFCLRVREAGYVNVWTPYAELYHHESATRGLEDSPQKQARFNSEVAYMAHRWPLIKRDCAYNPNLTLDHEDFSLAWPPRFDE